MRSRTTTLLALALLAVALPLAAAGAATARRPSSLGAAPGAMLERAAQRLELTPAQKEEIRAILAAHKTELERELLAIKAARTVLWDAIHAPAPNDNAIRTAAAAVGRAEGELAVTRADIVVEVRAVLTPEQQAELAEMTSDFRSFVQSLLERLHGQLDAAL